MGMDVRMIRSVFIGTDASVGVYNEANDRIIELSGKYEDVHAKLFEILKSQKVAPGFYDQRVAKALATAGPRGL
jgi:hypothetical protein